MVGSSLINTADTFTYLRERNNMTRELPKTMTRLGIDKSACKSRTGEGLVNHMTELMHRTYSNMDDFTIKSIDAQPTNGWYYANIEYKNKSKA